ncbi:MAG: 4Fe-4S binding protein [Muribaculaceae bacterium]
MTIKEYFSSLFKAIVSLVKGLEVTGKELVTPKVTEQYPENRATLKIADRFRATLEFDYNADGTHKCIACGICQNSCPNGTIEVQTKMVDMPDGKKKKKLDKYIYDLGSCTFCMLCVTNCPTKAIKFTNEFEQSVFSRQKLVKQLNYLPEKEAPAPAAPAKPAAPAAPAKPAAPAEPAEKPASTGAAPAAADDKVALEVEAPNGKVMTVKLAKEDVAAIDAMMAQKPELTKFQAMQAVIKAKKAPKA